MISTRTVSCGRRNVSCRVGRNLPPFRAAPTRVDFLTNPADFEVAFLGSLGLSTDFISAKTGLTPSQVLYRLKAAQVKRSYYRSGESGVLNAVIKHAGGPVARAVEKQVRHRK